MSDELEHLTPEQRKQVLEIYPKEIQDLESTDEGVKEDGMPVIKPEVDIPKDDRTPEQKEDWKKGYTDYDHKTNESERIQFGDDEIEVIEEDL